MTSAVATLLPVFLVIAGGFALRRTGLLAEPQWAAIDRLCYFVLFPAFFFKEIAGADFSGLPVTSTAAAMALAIIAMSALLILAHRPLCAGLQMTGAQFSSFFQGVVRWHTFIAFAAVPLYFGEGRLALAALAAAVMTPLLNLICVPVIGHFANGGNFPLASALSAIIRNPFLLSSLAGVLWNLSGLGLALQIEQTLDITSRGALGLALLSVGAALRIETFALSARAISAAAALKLIAMPALVALALMLFCVNGEAAGIAILCNAVPTGSGAYILARQLGGDAPLMATILTVEVIAAALTIPLVLAVLG